MHGRSAEGKAVQFKEEAAQSNAEQFSVKTRQGSAKQRRAVEGRTRKGRAAQGMQIVHNFQSFFPIFVQFPPLEWKTSIFFQIENINFFANQKNYHYKLIRVNFLVIKMVALKKLKRL